jgi:hypothetical protein
MLLEKIKTWPGAVMRAGIRAGRKVIPAQNYCKPLWSIIVAQLEQCG